MGFRGLQHAAIVAAASGTSERLWQRQLGGVLADDPTDDAVDMVPLDTKGRARMVERDIPVECGGVQVIAGDIVFGDVDGVVVIPQTHELAVIEKAIAKVTGENNTRDALRKGESLGDAFKRFGIL